MRRRARIAGALAAGALIAAAAVGCGDDVEDEPTGGDGAPASVTVLQPTRSGSFLPTGGEGYELVLRGVGGAASLGAESATPGGSAGSVATSALARRPEDLLGPPPWTATIAGAEVLPQAYELELSEIAYDGVRQQLSFDAAVSGGLPETPPPSFGAATLEIASSLPAGSLAGTVVSAGGGSEEAGTPIEGALVEVQLAGKGIATALTDADGRFEIAPMAGSPFIVAASRPGYERERRPTGLGEDLELELVPISE